jgi:tetratricopeptide (TPR) repeat protein
MTDDDLVERLNRATSTPYGKARSALLEDVVRRADAAGNDELAFYARLALVTAYVMGAEPRKSLVPFARCVTDWDADPAKYQEHAQTFLWCFKYVPSTLTKFPEVSLAQTNAVVDDMERRWRAGGHSMHAVHHYRWLVANHVGDAGTAAEEYRLWSTAPRDGLSDCIGCDPTAKARHLIETGRPADAVALATGVLDGQLTCNEQPQQMLTALLSAYVAEGMYSEAVDAHRRAYRILRNSPGELDSYAEHIIFCARTGNETRAVELIERHLNELADPPTTYAEMRFAAAAAHALGRVDLMIRRPQDTDIASTELSAQLAERAIELAAQFDVRNGTGHQSADIRSILDAEPWLEYLPLSETARRAHARRQAQAPARIEEEVAVGPDPVGSGWLDRAEEDWQNDRREQAIAAWQAFEREVPESERTKLDQARVLDGRGLASLGQGEEALDAWREALTLYSELGEEVRLLRDRGRIARVLGEVGRIEEGLATGEQPLRWLIDNDEPRRQGGWQYSLATLLAQAGRGEESLQELTILRSAPDSEDELRAAAGILQCNLLIQLEQLEEAESAATAGLATRHDLPRSFAYRQRGWIRIALNRPDEAVADLEEAVALATGAPDAEVHVAICRLELARAYLYTDRPLESAETGEEALPVLRDPELASLRADVRGVLVDAYRALGELEPALTQVRTLLADAPEDAHPQWLGNTRQEEGLLLERMDRDKEAVDAFLMAAEHFETAELPIAYVQAIRLGAQSARYAGDFDLTIQLLDRARPVLESLPSADQSVLFQQAGIHWDLAMLKMQQGSVPEAIEQARSAAEYYERGGFEGQLINARLLIAEHGTTDDVMLQEIFAGLPTGDEVWYRAG